MTGTAPGLSPTVRRALIIAAVAVSLAAAVLVSLLVFRASNPVVEPPLASEVTIVVSPHPDDETYAMGQSIAAQTLAGKRVVAVLLTDGEGSNLVAEWAQSAGRDMNDDGVIDKWDFGLARREEFSAAMRVLGVEEVVFLGTAASRGAQGLKDGALVAEEVAQLLRPVADEYPGSAWFTTAAHAFERLYRGDYRDHPDHAQSAAAVSEVVEASGGTAYNFKVYVYYLPPLARLAPQRVRGSEEARALKRAAIDAYAEIGKLSTPELFEASGRDEYEYLVPASDR